MQVFQLLFLHWEVMIGRTIFLLPQRGVVTRAEMIEITLGRMVFQTRYRHEDPDGGEAWIQGAAQGISHKGFVVHLCVTYF